MFDDELYINLRIASNNRQDLKRQLIKEKVILIALLDEYFPELRRLFADILGKSPLALLKNCPFSKDIKSFGIAKVTNILKEATKNRVGIKKVTLVYEAASGMKKGKTKISKRGRPNLRSIFYQVALVMVAKNDAFNEIYRHLTKRERNQLVSASENSVLKNKQYDIYYKGASKV